ncbi:hypothetical protein LIER_20380 [Lithospermum erythrorhizon]|uniref:Uncharacterized protein n=1 Tax=Lithospermum erythrorhizon TaxID=34254 RepID=A0AAV3QMQ0_LITER
MADKASRGVILYGDGLARRVEPSHTNLHSFASLASCGLASLPNSPSQEDEGARRVREFAELLDATHVSMGTAEANLQGNNAIPTLSERFMGMKAAIIANDSCLQSCGSKLGLNALEFNDLVDSRQASADTLVLASALLRLLGFEEGKISDVPQFDLVFIYIGAGSMINGVKDMDFINNLVGALTHTAQPGTEIGSRLHMSVIMSYGAVSSDDKDNFPISTSNHEYKPDLAQLVPRQSYTLKEGKERSNLRHYCPMLIAQWQNAVTRTDMVESYFFEDFKHAGNLVIPADRVVHEIAFKLWKAPKYGA